MKFFASYYHKTEGTTYSPIQSSLENARAWVRENSAVISQNILRGSGVDVWSSVSSSHTDDAFEGVYTLVERLEMT